MVRYYYFASEVYYNGKTHLTRLKKTSIFSWMTFGKDSASSTYSFDETRMVYPREKEKMKKICIFWSLIITVYIYILKHVFHMGYYIKTKQIDDIFHDFLVIITIK